MKIVIFGLTISSSWGNGHATPYRAITKALHRQGHEVHFFEKDVPYYARHRDFESPDYCSLHLYPNWDSVREFALNIAAESDAVICASFCPEGARIADEVLALSRPVKAFYDLDTPVTLARLESGPLEYLRREQIPEFDLYLSFTGGGTLDELANSWHAKRALPLYGCVDPEVHTRVAVPPQYCCDFSYMGTYASDRQAKVETLFLEPARHLPATTFVLAGSMYPRDWQWPANVRRFEHVGVADHSALYSSSRLTLNVTRTEMTPWGYCPSGRFFEAAACGTPIVTDWFEGLDHFFDCSRDLVVANSSEDVIAALMRPDAELAEMALRARERTLDEHTGDRRARELIAALESAGTTSHKKARREVA
ncbi:MAG: glycosyltransferase [Acidobacteria bacterium]|nr:glycosyltransferase [Acidobacteriota bacterium]